MDKYDLRRAIDDADDDVQGRWILGTATKRLSRSIRKYFDTDDQALDKLLTVYNTMGAEMKSDKTEQTNPAAAGHDDLYPYPADFPISLYQHLIDLLRGTIPDPTEAAHYGWHVVGFALGLWQGKQPLQAGAGTLTKEQAIEQLEAAKGQGLKAVGAIDWKGLALLILGILQQLLAKQSP